MTRSTVGDCRPADSEVTVTQHEVKREQPVVQGGHPQGAPSVTEFMTLPLYWAELAGIWGKQFWLKLEPRPLGFCALGHSGRPSNWAFLGPY